LSAPVIWPWFPAPRPNGRSAPRTFGSSRCPLTFQKSRCPSTPTIAGPPRRRSTGCGRSSALSGNSSSDPASESGSKRESARMEASVDQEEITKLRSQLHSVSMVTAWPAAAWMAGCNYRPAWPLQRCCPTNAPPT